MRTAKKAVALLLSVLMLVSAFPVGVLAQTEASSEAREIKLNDVFTANIEFGGDYEDFAFTPEVTGTYVFYSLCEDTSDTFGEIYDDRMVQIGEDDQGGTENNFRIAHEMNAGQTYYLRARYWDRDETGSFPVSVSVAKTMTSISFEDVKMVEGDTETEEYEDEETGEMLSWEWYDYTPAFTVFYSDGTSERLEGNSFYDDISWYGINLSADQTPETPWGVGTHQVTATVSKDFAGNDPTYTFNVEIVENPIASITGTTKVFLENNGGTFTRDNYFDNELGEWLESPEYYYYSNYGTTFHIVLKDGTEYDGDYVSFNGKNHYIDYRPLQNYNNRWTVGNTYTVPIKVLGFESSYEVKIVKSPVTSVSVDPIRVMEGTHGYLRSDDNGEYYHYSDLPIQNITITLDDGSEFNTCEVYWNGTYFYVEQDETDQSFLNQWKGGNTYYIPASILDYDFVIPVEIINSPITSITVSDVLLVENSGGRIRRDEIWNQELQQWETTPEYYYYDNYHPGSMTITMADGTVTDDGYVEWNNEIHYLSARATQNYENQWTVGNTYTIEASILGYSFTYNVSIVETPIASIYAKPVKLIENTGGSYCTDRYYDETLDQWLDTPKYYKYDGYHTDFIVTMKDGNVYEGSYFWWNGEEYYINANAIQDYENQWTVGNTYKANVNVLGYQTSYDVSIVETPVLSVDYDTQEIVEGTGGYYTTSSLWNEEKGLWVESPEYYRYQTSFPLITITLKNGSVFTNNDPIIWEGREYWIQFSELNQDYNHRWTVGNTYSQECSILGYNFTVDTKIVETPVSKVELKKPIVYFEGANGSMHRDRYYDAELQQWLYSEEYFRYSFSYSDFIVTMKDGTVFDSTNFDYNGVHYWMQELENDDDQSYENQWKPGNTYSQTRVIAGFVFEFEVEIIDTPIESVTVSDVMYLEHTNGYYTTEPYYDPNMGWLPAPEEFFRYHVFPSGMVIKMKDGTTFEGSMVEWNGSQYGISLSYNQSYINQWLVGGTYEVSGSILGYKFTFNVSIIDTPVESVTVKPVMLAEKMDGYYSCDEYFDEELGYYVQSPEYFFYDAFYPSEIEITLKSGEKITATGFEWNGGSYCVEITSHGQSYENQWQAGGVYDVHAHVLGYDFTYEVEIVGLSSNDEYEFIEMDEGVSITDIFHPTETLEIPATINGKPVLSISQVSKSSVVKNLILPDSLVALNSGVIASFENLETVSFGASADLLWPSLFGNSYKLREIRVSSENQNYCAVDGVLYNKDMTELVCFPVAKGTTCLVPDSVESVDRLLQMNIYANTEFVFSETHPKFVTIDGVTYTKDMTRIVFCSKNKAGAYDMPDTVKEISDMAFMDCDKLTEVTVSSQVTEIVYCIFASCASLEKVDLPEGLVSIGYRAFEDTPALKSITLPETLESIGDRSFAKSGLTAIEIPDATLSIGSRAFSESKLASLDLGDGVESISSRAFEETPLTGVELPDSLQFLGNAAFMNCKDLASVTIGSGLDYIDIDTFFGTGLESVHIPANIQAIMEYAFGSSALEEITFDDGVMWIGEGAFAGCNNLTAVEIPRSVNSLDSLAFSSCDSLVSFTVEEGNETYYSTENCIITTQYGMLVAGCGSSVIPADGTVAQICDYAFYGSGLTQVTIPDSVAYVGTEAFAASKNLATVIIGDGVEEMGEAVFAGCPITTLKLSDNLGYLSALSFEGAQMSELFIPNSVTDIMYGSFARCSKLTSIELPLSVQFIEAKAFEECESLTDVYYEGSVEDRANMFIDPEGNDALANATWHYNWTNDKWYDRTECSHLYDNDCDDTCNLCGESRPVRDHVYDNDRDADCNECGFVREITPESPPICLKHIYDNACDTTCNNCGSVREVPGHTGGTATCTDKAVCTECGASYGEVLDHTYDNACDTDCNACGGVREVPGHTGGTATCTDKAVCTECGVSYGEVLDHTYDNACDTTCNACGGAREVEDHKFDNNCDTTCNVCGFVRDVEHTYDNACDSDCNFCGETRKPADHVYDDQYDATCNTCGAVRDVPTKPSEPSKQGTFYVESAVGKAGDTVVVKVKVKDNPGIVSFKVDLSFDSSVLELVSIEEGDFAGTVFGKDLTVNPVPMNWFDGVNPNNMTNGTLAILTFKIMDNASTGQTPITLTFDEDNVFDSENNNIPFTIEDGCVTIIEYILGDANDDGKVNNKDLVAIQRYINSWGNSINVLAADYNEDGKINNKDLVAIQRFINGWFN